MRKVETRPPSFPEAALNEALTFSPDTRWQVLCGDTEHWRCGIYAPEHSRPEEIAELETHDCPELFVLLDGRVSLLLADDGGERVLELKPHTPVLVTCRHAGFCPDGPHTGHCLVIERDRFDTHYSPR